MKNTKCFNPAPISLPKNINNIINVFKSVDELSGNKR